MSKELTEKIIIYLKKLAKNEVLPKISSRKKGLLLASLAEYEKIDQAEKECQELSQSVNKEEGILILDEIKKLTEQKEEIITKIKEQIIEEESISQNVVVEIRPGPGGDEAGLFVNDLYCMYANFAKKKR